MRMYTLPCYLDKQIYPLQRTHHITCVCMICMYDECMCLPLVEMDCLWLVDVELCKQILDEQTAEEKSR